MTGVVTAARLRALFVDFVVVSTLLAFAGVGVPFRGFALPVFVGTAAIAALVNRRRRKRFMAKVASLAIPREPVAMARAMADAKTVAKGGGLVVVGPDGTDIVPVGAWTADSVAELGSISKALTGLALASMVLDKTVSLDDPIKSYLRVTGALGDITIGELASHTSGLSRLGSVRSSVVDIFFTGSSQPYRSWAKDGVVRAAQKSTVKERGRLYSNLGFGLLGVVLSRAANEPFGAVLASRVFEPAGMKHASLIDSGPRAQPGHDALGLVTPSWKYTGGAGGVQASLRDMASLADTLRKPRGPLAKPFALARTQVGPDTPFAYGLGWSIKPSDDAAPLFWHNGGTGGFSTFFGVRDKTAWFVAVDRTTGFMADRVFAELAKQEPR